VLAGGLAVLLASGLAFGGSGGDPANAAPTHEITTTQQYEAHESHRAAVNLNRIVNSLVDEIPYRFGDSAMKKSLKTVGHNRYSITLKNTE
jgi:hypothetical protein